MAFRIGTGLSIVAVAAVLAGCVPVAAEPTPTETFDFDIPPRWVEDEDTGEPRVSFAAGADLIPGSRVDFRSSLGSIYDWEVVDSPTAELAELVNVNAGCRVRDETMPYAGSDDDEVASRELVAALLVRDEIIGGPQPGIAGIGEGLGEGAPHYHVIHALAEAASGGYVYVTGRVFAALGIQHSITVRCELGGYLDRTRAQLATTTWVELALPEDTPPPVVVAAACTLDDLTIVYSPFEPGVDALTGILEFRNEGGRVCSVEGHPGVHFSDAGSASTHGPIADLSTTWATVPVDLPRGATATAYLTIRRASTMCAAPIPIDGLVVAPPTEPFDPAAEGRYLRVRGLEVCPDAAVQLLRVEGIAR